VHVLAPVVVLGLRAMLDGLFPFETALLNLVLVSNYGFALALYCLADLLGFFAANLGMKSLLDQHGLCLGHVVHLRKQLLLCVDL
jgi:hypothetical protein